MMIKPKLWCNSLNLLGFVPQPNLRATPARMPAMSDAKNGWFAKDGWVKRVQNVTGEKTDFKFKD